MGDDYKGESNHSLFSPRPGTHSRKRADAEPQQDSDQESFLAADVRRSVSQCPGIESRYEMGSADMLELLSNDVVKETGDISSGCSTIACF